MGVHILNCRGEAITSSIKVKNFHMQKVFSHLPPQKPFTAMSKIDNPDLQYSKRSVGIVQQKSAVSLAQLEPHNALLLVN